MSGNQEHSRVDDLAIVLQALTPADAGPSAASALSAEQDKLRAALIRKYGDVDARLERALADFVSDPETYAASTRQLLMEAGVDHDLELIERARRVSGRGSAPLVTGGRIDQIDAHNSTVIAIGRDQTGTIYTGPVTTADIAHQVSGLENPYRGLDPFTYENRDSFAGRKSVIDAAVAMLAQPGDARTLLFIIGASGSGKSSLAQAGILPALEQHYRQRQLDPRMAVFRPSKRPLNMLADALVRMGLSSPATQDASATIGTADTFARFVQGATPARQVNLLVIDQFEELFITSEVTQREALIAILAALPSFAEIRTHVVLTMRPEYLDRLFPVRALYDVATTQAINLREMSEDELRLSIQRPLQAMAHRPGFGNKSWEQELVDRLASEAAQNATYLPLLQVTLQEIWKRGSLTLAAYQTIGMTLTDAIRQRATAVYEFIDYDMSPPSAARPEKEREAVLELFLDLVEVSTDQSRRGDVRRRRLLTDLVGDADSSIAAMRDRLVKDLTRARLLSIQFEEETKAAFVDLIHESLIARWDLLQRAIDTERSILQQRARFEQDLGRWQASGRLDDYLLRGVRLAEARALAARHDIAVRETLGSAYLTDSLAREEMERRSRRRRQAAVGTAFVLLVFAGLAGVAVTSRMGEAQALGEVRARATAEAAAIVARDEAKTQQRIASSREVAANAAAQMAIDPELSVLLAQESLKLASTEQARDVLRIALLQSPIRKLLVGHTGEVTRARFSPDNRQLLTASEDASARLWDVASGRLLHELKGHTAGITDAQFSSDGRFVLTASRDGTARLWDASSARTLAELGGHNAVVTTANFSPDASTVVTATGDGSARLWSTNEGRTLTELRGHTGAIVSAQFSPDGNLVATASLDGTARLWRVGAGQPVSELRGHTSALTGVTFSPDSTRVLTASIDRTARVWDAASGRLVAVLDGHSSGVTAAVFSPNGRSIATASQDRTARLWDAETGATSAVLDGHTSVVIGVLFAPDGQLLATSSLDRTARLWNATSGASLAVMRGHTREIADAAFSPDGTLLATGGFDTTSRIWAVRAGPEAMQVRGHSGQVYAAQFSRDGRFLITGGTDNAGRIWDTVSLGQLVELRGHGGAVTDAQFSPDGNLVATASVDGTARVWERTSGRTLTSLQGHGGWVYSASFSPDSSMLVTASADRTARVWDLASGQLRHELQGHEANVTSAEFSPDGSRIITSSEDGTARVWEVGSGRAIRELRGHGADVRSAHFSHDGALAVTASADRTARVWELSEGHTLAELRGHDGAVYRAEFSPDDRLLVTAGEDWTARTWELRSGLAVQVAELRGNTAQVWSATFSPDAQHVVTSGADGTVRLYPVETFAPPDDLLSLAQTRVVRQLTTEERRKFLHE